MSLETEVQNLTTQTTALLNAVNTSKATLDNRRDAAAASANAAAVSETNAANSAAAAAASESNAAASASAAAASASAAASSASNAETSASEATTSEANAATSASSAAASATAAGQSALDANAAADIAAAAAAYKGEWADLSGSLDSPASVSHKGLLWLLKNNISNVATNEPGVSSSWQLAIVYNIGSRPDQVPTNGLLGEMAFMDKSSVVVSPPPSSSPQNPRDMVFELTNDTTLKIKVKGADGVVRSVTLTLA